MSVHPPNVERLRNPHTLTPVLSILCLGALVACEPTVSRESGGDAGVGQFGSEGTGDASSVPTAPPELEVPEGDEACPSLITPQFLAETGDFGRFELHDGAIIYRDRVDSEDGSTTVGALMRLDLETKEMEVIWKAPPGEEIHQFLHLDGDDIYFSLKQVPSEGSTYPAYFFYSVPATGGAALLISTQNTQGYGSSGTYVFAVDDAYIYAQTDGQGLVAVSRVDGHDVRLTEKLRIAASHQLFDGKLWFTQQGRVDDESVWGLHTLDVRDLPTVPETVHENDGAGCSYEMRVTPSGVFCGDRVDGGDSLTELYTGWKRPKLSALVEGTDLGFLYRDEGAPLAEFNTHTHEAKPLLCGREAIVKVLGSETHVVWSERTKIDDELHYSVWFARR